MQLLAKRMPVLDFTAMFTFLKVVHKNKQFKLLYILLLPSFHKTCANFRSPISKLS